METTIQAFRYDDMWMYFPQILPLEAHRRSMILILALQAWRLEHGRLPETLGRLSDSQLSELLDPYSGTPFGYRPQGLPVPLTWTAPRGALNYTIATPQVEANTPFLFSMAGEGNAVSLDRRAEDGETVYGWFFPIP